MTNRGLIHNSLFLMAVMVAASACKMQAMNSQQALTSNGDGVASGTSGGSSSGSSGSTGGSGPQPLSLTSLSPSQISFKSGGLLVLRGTGFSARTRILIDGKQCPNPGIISSTEATCFAPGTPTTGQVKVRVFEYTDPTTFYERDLNYVTDGFSTVTMVAGSVFTGETPGQGTNAEFYDLRGSAILGNFLYVADYGNSAIWRIDIDTAGATPFDAVELIGTSSNYGTDDGDFSQASATPATLYGPQGLVAVGTDLLYFTDRNCIREANLTSQKVTTVAGLCTESGAINATGSSARFSSPEDLATDGTYLYVADSDNNMIRKVSLSTFAVTTLAGQRTAGKADLPGTSAKFKNPGPLTRVGNKLYVGDRYNYAVRVIDLMTTAVSTLTGGRTPAADGPASVAGFDSIDAMTSDGTDLFVVNRSSQNVRRVVVATGEVRLLAGQGDGLDDTIYHATLHYPAGIIFSPTLGLLVGGTALWQIQ